MEAHSWFPRRMKKFSVDGEQEAYCLQALLFAVNIVAKKKVV
jgi:hypothetical protein